MLVSTFYAYQLFWRLTARLMLVSSFHAYRRLRLSYLYCQSVRKTENRVYSKRPPFSERYVRFEFWLPPKYQMPGFRFISHILYWWSQLTTEPEWIDQSSVSARKDKHKCIVKAMGSPHYKDEVALGLRQHSWWIFLNGKHAAAHKKLTFKCLSFVLEGWGGTSYAGLALQRFHTTQQSLIKKE
jgi:hypothetical protein